MKIGILSDTHNNLENLMRALHLLRLADVDTLIHCGDLTDPELLRQIAGFRVLYVFGNGDTSQSDIREGVLALHPAGFAGHTFTGEVGAVKIAAAHGHLSGAIDSLVHSGQYTYVFRGHSHLHQDEQIGATRLINPGALGGTKREPRQFCILDLQTGDAQFVEVE